MKNSFFHKNVQYQLVSHSWINHYELINMISYPQQYDPLLVVVEEWLAQMWIDLIFDRIEFSLIESVS